MSVNINNKASSYIPSLDGLRGISILTVLAAHLGFERYIPGGLGVTVFFFISGYLITNLMVEEHKRFTKINLKFFFLRRILRLYPPLLVMIFVVLAFLLWTSKPFDLHEVYAALFYYENYYSFYSSHEVETHFGTLWSLAVEEHFYIVFPFIYLIFSGNVGTFIKVLIVLTISAMLIRVYGAMSYPASRANWYCYLLTHTRFDSILFGCIASLLFHSQWSQRFFNFLENRLWFVVSIILLCICLLVRNDIFRNTLRYSIQGVALLIIIPAIVKVDKYNFLDQILSNNVLVYIGKLSYSIYLFHMFAIELCLPFNDFNGGMTLFLVGSFVATMLLALFSYYAVEIPLSHLRKRLRPTARLSVKDVPTNSYS